MTPAAWFLLCVLAWLGLGVLLGFVLGRRGFDGLSWFLIGTLLGPLSVLIAWNCIRRDERLGTEIVATPASVRSATGIDVLVGVDGSPESEAAVSTAMSMFGDQLGRLTLVGVVPFDDAPEARAAIRGALERVAGRLSGWAPSLEIVRGHPATALAAAAAEGDFDVLVVGTTGHGRAHPFGSAAKELAHTSCVPVLLAGRPVAVAAG